MASVPCDPLLVLSVVGISLIVQWWLLSTLSVEMWAYGREEENDIASFNWLKLPMQLSKWIHLILEDIQNKMDRNFCLWKISNMSHFKMESFLKWGVHCESRVKNALIREQARWACDSGGCGLFALQIAIAQYIGNPCWMFWLRTDICSSWS